MKINQDQLREIYMSLDVFKGKIIINLKDENDFNEIARLLVSIIRYVNTSSKISFRHKNRVVS